VRLLWPVAFVIVTVVGMLVTWAVLRPENTRTVTMILCAATIGPFLI
jgi:hypothetical protein